MKKLTPAKGKTMTSKTTDGWPVQAETLLCPGSVAGMATGRPGAVILEHVAGDPFSELLGLPKIPVLFGALVMLKKPLLIPSVLIYVLVIYGMPLALVGRLCSGLANQAAKSLLHFSKPFSVLIHLALLYAVLHTWSDLSAYRLLTLKFTLIAVMLTLSLNVINGYMGEFSCSHPGFMALGAYAASTFTLSLFVNDRLFGAPLLPPSPGTVSLSTGPDSRGPGGSPGGPGGGHTLLSNPR